MKQLNQFYGENPTPRSLDFRLTDTRTSETKDEFESGDHEWTADLHIAEPVQLLEGSEADLELHRQFSCPNFVRNDKRGSVKTPNIDSQLLELNRGQSVSFPKTEESDHCHAEDFVTPKMSSIGRILEEIRMNSSNGENPKCVTEQIQKRIDKLMNAPQRGDQLSDFNDR